VANAAFHPRRERVRQSLKYALEHNEGKDYRTDDQQSFVSAVTFGEVLDQTQSTSAPYGRKATGESREEGDKKAYSNALEQADRQR
jgi:hypothetical protein